MKIIISILILLFTQTVFGYTIVDKYCFTNNLDKDVYITMPEINKSRNIEKGITKCFYVENEVLTLDFDKFYIFHFSTVDYNPKYWRRILPETMVVREWHKIKLFKQGQYNIFFKNKMLEVK